MVKKRFSTEQASIAVFAQLDRIEEKIDALHTLNAEKFKLPPPPDVKAINLILRLLAQGKKIEAIWKYREVFGVGIREAKEAVRGELHANDNK